MGGLRMEEKVPEVNRTSNAARNAEITKHRRDNIVPETGHDTYRRRGKPKDPSVCPRCDAVFHKGHWQWIPAPAGSHEDKCPACLRIEDKYPAGFVTLEGDFFAAHQAEIVHLVRNQAATEEGEHPLNRIIELTEAAGHVEVTTTDLHMARRIAEAVNNAYAGELDLQYAEDDTIVRVHWKR